MEKATVGAAGSALVLAGTKHWVPHKGYSQKHWVPQGGSRTKHWLESRSDYNDYWDGRASLVQYPNMPMNYIDILSKPNKQWAGTDQEEKCCREQRFYLQTRKARTRESYVGQIELLFWQDTAERPPMNRYENVRLWVYQSFVFMNNNVLTTYQTYQGFNKTINVLLRILLFFSQKILGWSLWRRLPWGLLAVPWSLPAQSTGSRTKGTHKSTGSRKVGLAQSTGWSPAQTITTIEMAEQAWSNIPICQWITLIFCQNQTNSGQAPIKKKNVVESNDFTSRLARQGQENPMSGR